MKQKTTSARHKRADAAPARRYYGVFGCADGDREDTFLCFHVASRGEAIEAFYRDMEDEEDPHKEVFVNLVVKSDAFVFRADPDDSADARVSS